MKGRFTAFSIYVDIDIVVCEAIFDLFFWNFDEENSNSMKIFDFCGKRKSVRNKNPSQLIARDV